MSLDQIEDYVRQHYQPPDTLTDKQVRDLRILFDIQ